MMGWFERMLDALDSSGGHLFLLMLLVVGGCLMSVFGIPKAEDVIVGGVAGFLGALKTTHSNFTRRGGTGSGEEESSTITTETTMKAKE